MPSIRLCRGFSEIPPSPPTMSDFLSEGKLLDAFRSVVSRKFRDVGPTLEDTCAHYAFLFSRCSPPRSRAVDTARCVRIPCSGHIGSWSSPPARKCRRESQDCSPKSSQSDSHRKAPSWWWMRVGSGWMLNRTLGHRGWRTSFGIQCPHDTGRQAHRFERSYLVASSLYRA